MPQNSPRSFCSFFGKTVSLWVTISLFCSPLACAQGLENLDSNQTIPWDSNQTIPWDLYNTSTACQYHTDCYFGYCASFNNDTGFCWSNCDECHMHDDAVDKECPTCPYYLDACHVIVSGIPEPADWLNGLYFSHDEYAGRPYYVLNDQFEIFVFWTPGWDRWTFDVVLGGNSSWGFNLDNVVNLEDVTSPWNFWNNATEQYDAIDTVSIDCEFYAAACEYHTDCVLGYCAVFNDTVFVNDTASALNDTAFCWSNCGDCHMFGNPIDEECPTCVDYSDACDVLISGIPEPADQLNGLYLTNDSHAGRPYYVLDEDIKMVVYWSPFEDIWTFGGVLDDKSSWGFSLDNVLKLDEVTSPWYFFHNYTWLYAFDTVSIDCVNDEEWLEEYELEEHEEDGYEKAEYEEVEEFESLQGPDVPAPQAVKIPNPGVQPAPMPSPEPVPSSEPMPSQEPAENPAPGPASEAPMPSPNAPGPASEAPGTLEPGSGAPQPAPESPVPASKAPGPAPKSPEGTSGPGVPTPGPQNVPVPGNNPSSPAPSPATKVDDDVEVESRAMRYVNLWFLVLVVVLCVSIEM